MSTPTTRPTTRSATRTGTATTAALVAVAAFVPVGTAAGYRAAASESATTTALAPRTPGTAGSPLGQDGTSGAGGTGDSTGPGTSDQQGWAGDQGLDDGSAWGGTGGSNGSGPSGWGRMTSRGAVSGTPLASAKGVVLIGTALPGGQGAGTGTGITLSADGTVLTNYHVVEGATRITVTDSTTGHAYRATVVGHDESHDIAVLRLQGASGLSTAVVNETLPSLGDPVTAVGQGGGRGVLYAAQGVVTSTDEQITAGDGSGIEGSETLTGLIETTADVVPGYSGGPLLDTAGRVVGIDTAASSGRQVDGYAVPMGQAMTIARQIQAGTRSATVHIGPRAALGVTVAPSAQVQGAAVVEVSQGSAAQAAGITAGSVVTAVDGAPVTSATALTKALADDYPGTRVRVSWTDANGTTRTRAVVLGTNPAA